MPLPDKARLSKAKFTKKIFTSEDLLEHLGEKISSIHFTHGEQGATPVTVRYKLKDAKNSGEAKEIMGENSEVASGGENVKEALAWLIVAVYEHEHPEPEPV